MRTHSYGVLFLSLLLALAGILVWSGCEADTATQTVVISPESVVVKLGQTVKFSASGGYDYRWNLDPNDGSGALNTSFGNSVLYTCLTTNGSTPKRIEVVSTIEGSSSGTTNTPAYSAQAYAEIFYPFPTVSSSSSTNSSSTSTNSP